MLQTAPLPVRPVGQVLMLHGGAEHGHQPVDGRSLALRRTKAMYDAVAPRLRDRGVVVSLLRFSVRGWNATASPVADTRTALDTLAERHPGLPVVLVGHSMGARAAAWAADHPSVVGVVGLAPWFPGDDPVEQLAGLHLVAAHGRRDRITSARQTRTYVARAGEVAASARFVDMGRLGHYMLTGIRRWNEIAVTEALEILDVGTVTSRD
ncbi:MAG: alpha/beta fold hydrolase [Nocardioidaceae bacterium]|nr:alpha/beta fold hydrolase [Nocardioidaceae bacterium]